ncbi:MAG: hypothetical protein KDC26_05110 [Armatimonadetes bacterium]|nr:hypothetical protein [Armatimonadota bacterium]
MISAILTLLASQADGSAQERLLNFYRNTNEFTVGVRARDESGTVREVSWYLKRPNRQSFQLNSGLLKFGYNQSHEAILAFDHRDASYVEYGPTDGFSSAPPGTAISFFYPSDLLQLITGALDNTEFKPIPKMNTYRGEFEAVRTQYRAGQGVIQVDFAVDDLGQVVKLISRDAALPAQLQEVYEFTPFDRSPKQMGNLAAIPNGYMPDILPIRSAPLVPGAKPPYSEWQNARTGKSDNVQRLRGTKNTIVLFSSPECKISPKLRTDLLKLQSELGKHNAEIIEVSIGKAKPKGEGKHPLYWDESGEIEKKWGIPVTPYVYITSKKGYIARAWAGYADSEFSRMKKTVLGFYENEE